MKTIYVCTHVEKTICEDDYEDGCDTKQTCTMSERCDIGGDTIEELVKNIGNHFGLTMDDLFIPGDEDEKDTTSVIGFNRLENRYDDEPTEKQVGEWKDGKETLWLADYTFAVEKRTVEPIRLEEFDLAGLKTH